MLKPFLIFFLSILIKTINSQPPGNQFRLGFLHCDDEINRAYVNYRTSASAANIAIDRIKQENILAGYDFSLTTLMDNCTENLSAGRTFELINTYNVDVIFGPTTNVAGLPAFTSAAYYNIPLIAWGLTASAIFDDDARFPSAGTMSFGSRSLAVALRNVMIEFGWKQFVYAYSLAVDEEKCATLRDDIQDIVAYNGDIILAYSYQLMGISDDDMKTALDDVATKGRIIVTCFHEGTTKGHNRRWALIAAENGYATDEFVYIFPGLRSTGFTLFQDDGSTIMNWVDPINGPSDKDSMALIGLQRSITIVDMKGLGDTTDNNSAFSDEVIRRMKMPPYNCVAECSDIRYQTASSYAGQLHDAVYAYGRTMDAIMKTVPTIYKNGSYFMENFGQQFTGISGPVIINDMGHRISTMYIVILNSTNNNSILYSVYVDGYNGNATKLYKNEATDVWHFRKNGIRPLDEPVCGFTGAKCPPNVFIENLGWFIVAIFAISATIVGAIGAMFNMMRAKRQEVERQNALWQIPFHTMKQITKKNKGENSMRSISSGPSTISSTKSGISDVTETRHYVFFTIQTSAEIERVAARKHNSRPLFDSKTCAFMRQMRLIDHANLNRFIGLSLDAPQLYSVWRFCSRGSLADVIRKASLQMDGFFIYSLMKDIVNGLIYLHDSNIEFHGMLTSKNCLLNDRWQLKITDFGLRSLRQYDQCTKLDLLWSGPEHLRNDDVNGSKEGDVYSLGIISAELITKKSVFDIENRKEDAEELVYMLKKGGMKSPRPSLEHDDTIEINPALLHLVRDCWSEKPSERPTIKEVMSQLRSMNSNRNDNLMDHVFNVLESYASNLEDEVSERMKELVEEKKKSDLLLYRMLPKQVADKLKLGQTVEPETFDLVTLFFSDVVSFTTLAGKCTPLQVVNLLNDLYTIFDGIIDQHDVYKVETIGDGYLCVSGLPHRNGNEHTRHIASMSIAFMSCLTNFRIPHLPAERIKIRVGFHCGSVVSGVVGLTMPRYCLFGDAVNTASRMESNSKPGQIHISSEANQMLMSLGGFVTEPRGEVIIKGKGVLNTFWLLGMDESAKPKLKTIN